MIPRFAFLVHPLAPLHRFLLGVRTLHLPLVFQQEAGIEAVAVTSIVRIPTALGPADALITTVPDLPGDLLERQTRALDLMERAGRTAIGQGASVVGLGNALAVVAGRGRELAARLPVPVTTGQAATAWACAEIAVMVLAERGNPKAPVGVLGFQGTVGEATAERLRGRGVPVIVAEGTSAVAKRAKALGCDVRPLPDLLRECRVLLGTSTTGPTLDPGLLRPDTTLVDLSLPPTLHPGPRPSGFVHLKGEVLSIPGPLSSGVWGRIWLLLAGYGRGCVYACLAEPVAMAVTGESGFSEGRRLDPARVEAVGATLTRLGFRPVIRRRLALPSPARLSRGDG